MNSGVYHCELQERQALSFADGAVTLLDVPYVNRYYSEAGPYLVPRGTDTTVRMHLQASQLLVSGREKMS